MDGKYSKQPATVLKQPIVSCLFILPALPCCLTPPSGSALQCWHVSRRGRAGTPSLQTLALYALPCPKSQRGQCFYWGETTAQNLLYQHHRWLLVFTKTQTPPENTDTNINISSFQLPDNSHIKFITDCVSVKTA